MLRESDNAGAPVGDLSGTAGRASSIASLEAHRDLAGDKLQPTIEPEDAIHRPCVDHVCESSPCQEGSPSSTLTSGPSWRTERWCLARMLAKLDDPPIGFRLWDGAEITTSPAAKPAYWVHVRQRRALWLMLADPAFCFMEGYARGEIEIAGDLPAFLCELNGRWRLCQFGKLASSLNWGAGIMRRRSIHGSRHNVAHHYDLGNDFYRLWLDERLLYTCGYFPHAGMTLEAAQLAKMDHVCRKLRLQPGDEVVEAGCGWGALALHMARHYGVRVRAYNVSVEQVKSAREQARLEGLSDRVEFVQDDWRNIAGCFDAFVSIGMLEHVGPENYSVLGHVIQECLHREGRGLIHTIAQDFVARLNPWIERRIFPGAQPPALEQLAVIFSAGDLTVHDVENLRLHYAETLAHWLARFERSADTVRGMYDETFVRTWRMYLASSYSAFMTGSLQLFQVLFAPAPSNELPRTRAPLYRNADHLA